MHIAVKHPGGIRNNGGRRAERAGEGRRSQTTRSGKLSETDTAS